MTQKERSRKWYLLNREKAILNAAEWKKNNPERSQETQRKYRAAESAEKRRQYHRRWYANNRAKVSFYTRKRKYGVGTDQFNKMFQDQKGLCAICNKPLINPHIDHDHVTKRSRGLLCPNCNWILGYAHDNPEILESAIKYLRNPRWSQTGQPIESELKSA